MEGKTAAEESWERESSRLDVMALLQRLRPVCRSPGAGGLGHGAPELLRKQGHVPSNAGVEAG